MTRILLSLVICFSLSAQASPLEKPIYTEVYLRTSGQKVAGNVHQWDDDSVRIQAGKEDRTLKWNELTPTSAFTLRSRLIDKKKASDWLALGVMGWESGVKSPARQALNTAARLDPSLKQRVEEILAKPVAATNKANAKLEAAPTSAPAKYIKSTPEQDAAAIARAQQVAREVEKRVKVKLTELQTTHFIVFTDWDPREYEFLKTNVEAAYAAVTKQFDIPVKENVFVGKLPVFMFARQIDFTSFSQQFDELPANPHLLGYYAGHGNGTGHMAMWKPRTKVQGNQGRSAEEQWAYVLTHEFTHAFIDRYKSNRRIPRWLNEGVAEVIAQGQFPQPNRKLLAREMSGNGLPIEIIFDDEVMPPGEYYPVMESMVELLIRQNRKRFIELFDAIKNGENAEKALIRLYGVDYDGLVGAWKQAIVRS